jgi:hypothetical protein
MAPSEDPRRCVAPRRGAAVGLVLAISLAISLVLLANRAGAASADTAADAAAQAPPAPVVAPRMVPSLVHTLQLGMAVFLGTGYRGIFPYKEDIYCGSASGGNNQAAVCTNRAPTFLDLEPSFGVLPSFDLLLTIRLGLERDFNTRHQVLFMPGFRYWLEPERRVKFFTTLQLVYDRSNQNSTQVGNEDLGVRNSNGLMVDVMRNFGAYVQFGEMVGFTRWLSFTVDAGLGAEARFP